MGLGSPVNNGTKQRRLEAHWERVDDEVRLAIEGLEDAAHGAGKHPATYHIERTLHRALDLLKRDLPKEVDHG